MHTPLSLRLSLIPAALLLSSGVAYACSCIQSTPAENYQRADAVFLGTVTAVDGPDRDQMMTYTVEVEETFKWSGDKRGTIELRSHESTATCGMPMDEDESYLVYATVENGVFQTNLCSGSARETESKTILAELRTGTPDRCEPIICENGDSHPSCTADGHPINYFQHACQGGGQPFTDVPRSHAQFRATMWVRAANIAQGYANGTFGVGNPINRAEFIKMALLARHTQSEIDDFLSRVRLMPLPDVDSSAWFWGYVHFAKANGVISGYPDGTIKPGNTITMAEAAKIAVETMNVPMTTDPLTLEVWWQTYIRALRDHDALPASYTGPEQKVTRGDMAEILWKLDKAGF